MTCHVSGLATNFFLVRGRSGRSPDARLVVDLVGEERPRVGVLVRRVGPQVAVKVAVRQVLQGDAQRLPPGAEAQHTRQPGIFQGRQESYITMEVESGHRRKNRPHLIHDPTRHQQIPKAPTHTFSVCTLSEALTALNP